MTPAAEPRPGVRDVDPYVSPQLDVAARLNTNECPHPLPEGFFTELAEAVRDLPLHRYPDGQMTRLREELAAHHGHTLEGTWTANGSNEVLTELLLAYGGPGRTAVVFEPTYLLHSRLSWLTHTEVIPARARTAVHDRGRSDRRGARRRPRRRLRLLAQQPDRQRPAARGGDLARRAHERARDRRRGLHRVRRRERPEARRRPPERRRRAHVLEGVRDGGRAARIRADEPRGRRRPAAGAAPVPHVGAHPGSRDRGPAPHGRGPLVARLDPGAARPHRAGARRRSRA